MIFFFLLLQHWLTNCLLPLMNLALSLMYLRTKHLKKSNAACVYTPILLKLLILIQMCKKQKEGNFITINLTPHLSQLVKY